MVKQLMEDMRRMLAFDPRYVTPDQHRELVATLKTGGRARAERLTPEQRREIAKKASAARWAKAGKAS